MIRASGLRNKILARSLVATSRWIASGISKKDWNVIHLLQMIKEDLNLIKSNHNDDDHKELPYL